MKWVVREQQKKESEFNAGSKARNDVDSILVAEGYRPLVVNAVLDESQGKLKKIALQFSRYGDWLKCFEFPQKGDSVVIQYPVRNHTIFFANALRTLEKKGVRIIGVVHDLESLRLAISESSPPFSKLRFKYQELSALKIFSRIIVHNEHMRQAMHMLFDIPVEKMINLDLFDYLYEPKNVEEHAVFGGPVIIAGNLDKNKCGYIYNLPKDVCFDLYGANYDESCNQAENIHYRGKVKPDELPAVLRGSFGLVWDGPSPETCAGVFGEYLKYNNPHKASLYLSAGIPLIVWRKSALADFVERKKCGIIIDSLNDIGKNINCLNETTYKKIKMQVKAIQKQINRGNYTSEAILISESN